MTFLLPLIGLAAGIIAGGMLDGPLWGAIPILMGMAAYFIIMNKSKIPFKAAKLNSKHSIWIILLFSGIGIITSWFHRPMKFDDGETATYAAASGEIKEIISSTSGDILTVGIDRVYDSKGNGRDCRNLTILLTTDGFSASRGDIILFPCSLKPIEENGNRRNSGYAYTYARKGILYTTYAKSDDIRLKGHSSSMTNKAAGWRDRFAITLEKSSLKRETSEFIISILLGDRSLLQPDVKESFSNAGAAHVLALSGMHVAIIMGIILSALYPLKIAGLHMTRYWIAITAIWCYAFFTGLAPSTVRACIMTTFIVLAMSLQRKNASSNALLASAFIILICNPHAIYDVGMQLSFLCVGCIITFAGPLNQVSRHTHPRLHAINAAVLVSLVATMGTWVIVSFYFKRIPLLFLPVNLILLPLLPPYLALALLYTLLCHMGMDPGFLSAALDAGYHAFILVVEYLSAFGSATIEYQATLPVVILWLLGVLVVGYAMKRRKKLAAAATSLLLLAGSVALIPIMSSSQPDGMIFQKKYSEISMALYSSDKENLMSFPRNTVSRIDFKGNEIISVDCINQLDSLATAVMRGKTSKKKYLILGSGYKNRLRDIPGVDKFDRIILHPSVRRKKESELLEEAIHFGIDRIHSLRNDGPLEIDL